MPLIFRKPLILLGLMLAGLAAHADEYSDIGRLIRAGQQTEALSKADQYLAGKPKDPQMRFMRGVILAEMGKTNDAISAFTKLTEEYPELPEPYNNLAVIYAGQNQFDKARAALEMAIRTNPSYATAHENLGDVYARLASQAYSKALQLDSNNTAVQPKLNLIRELFAGNGKGKAPATAAAAPAAVAATKPTAAPAATPATAPVVAAASAPAAKPAAMAAAPVATPAAAPATTPAAAPKSTDTKDVEAAIQAWAHAWGSKDIKGYFAAYGSDFDNGGKASRREWEAERESRIAGKSNISVKISQLEVSVSGKTAVAHFRQEYKAGSLAVSSRKTLELVQAGSRWVIVREKAK